MSAGAGQQQIQLSELALPQLNSIKTQLDEELQHLTSSFGSLKQAQAKFADCIDSTKSICEANKDKSILVPLTNSLYVPGKIGDVERVVVDIGTGYYVEKDVGDAVKFYTEKVEFVNTRLEDLQKQIQQRQNNMRSVIEVMQAKMAYEQQMKAQTQVAA